MTQLEKKLGAAVADELKCEFFMLINNDDTTIGELDALFASYGLEPDYMCELFANL